jgi:hydrogenase maturation protease
VHLVRHALPAAGGGQALSDGLLVIGVGNEWRSDDGAGIALARLLAPAPPGVRVLAREGEPLDLIEEWTGAGEAIVVDAASSGAAPGTVHRLDARGGPLPVELFGQSTHALSVAEAVELGRALGRLPERLLVLGIEGERFGAGNGLTPAVEAAVGRLAAELRAGFARQVSGKPTFERRDTGRTVSQTSSRPEESQCP